jgi:MbtH protein
MRDDEQDGPRISRYRVVVNEEEQYSLLPEASEHVPGWRDAGKSGTKEECLSFVREVWTDMRPLSLRKAMDEQASSSPHP